MRKYYQKIPRALTACLLVCVMFLSWIVPAIATQPEEPAPTDSGLDLDFETADHANVLLKDNFDGHATNQVGEIQVDARDNNNHVLMIGSAGSGSAFRRYYSTSELGNEYELSFDMKRLEGNAGDISVWVRNTGTENGFRFKFEDGKISLGHYNSGNYNDLIVDKEVTAPEFDIDEWHHFRIKNVNGGLELYIDNADTPILVLEDAANASEEKGICFSGWNMKILLDNLKLVALDSGTQPEDPTPTDGGLDLDFETADHANALLKNDFLGYATNQVGEIQMDDRDDNNHVLMIGSAGINSTINADMAFRRYYSTSTLGAEYELSFDMKRLEGKEGQDISVWVQNNGSENGFCFKFVDGKIGLAHYNSPDYKNLIWDKEVTDSGFDIDEWHHFRIKNEDGFLELYIDNADTPILVLEDAINTPVEEGICFSSWNMKILLDNLKLTKLATNENQVKRPKVNVLSGTYAGMVTVEATCETEDATMYYTTDGTTPSAENGTKYTGPVTLLATTTFKIVAVKDGMDDSRAAIRNYTIEPVGDMVLTKNTFYLSVGDTSAVTGLFESDETDTYGKSTELNFRADATFQYVSSDTDVATVTDEGFIKAVGTGTATITASVVGGGDEIDTESCTVIVNPQCNTFYYVAPNGNDSNPGTEAQPLATLAGARDLIRSLETLPEGGVTVYFKEGSYYQDESVVFGTEDSGVAGKPIVYAAYNDDDVVIHSGKTIDNFQLLQEDAYPAGLPEAAKGEVYVAAVEEGWRPYDFYASGERQQVARMHNNDDVSEWSQWDYNWRHNLQYSDIPFMQKSPDGWEVKLNDGETDNLPSNGDVEMVFLPAKWWNSLPVVKNVNTETDTVRLHSRMPNINTETSIINNEILLSMLMSGSGYNLRNAPKFLDQPGEWCIDSEKGLLYWWPKTEEALNGELIAPYATELIRLEGDGEDESWAKQVEFVEFRGLTFAYTNRVREDQLNESEKEPVILRNSENPYPAIFLRGVENVSIVDCTIRHTGGYGVGLFNYAQNVHVTHCQFDDLGSGAVELYGYGPGTTDLNHHNTILGNKITNVGLNYMHSSGVTIFGSGYNDVKLNYIADVPYTSIAIMGTNPEAMNKDHFNQGCNSDTYGNQGYFYTLRKEELTAIDTSSSFANTNENMDLSARGGTILAMPYQHSQYNICSYNYTEDFMTVLDDGGAYYTWTTDYGNEFSYNLAKADYDTTKPLIHWLYMDDCALYCLIKGNAGWTTHSQQLDKSSGANVFTENTWSSKANDEPHAEYTALKNKQDGLMANLFGGYLNKEDTMPENPAPDPDEIAASDVEAMIKKIGTVTLDSKTAIDEARDAYDKLTEDQKNLVDNYSVLTAAEDAYTALVTEKADADAVAAAKELVSAADFDSTQTAISNENTARTHVTAKLAGLELNGVTAEITSLTYIAAVAGTVEDRDGTDGSIVATITLTKGNATDTVEITAIINATPFTETTTPVRPSHPVRPTVPVVPSVEKFPFTDVSEAAWYYDEVKEAWENDLIDGMTADKFAPDNSLTVAQAIKLAAALHQMYNDGKVTLGNGSVNWYSTYVNYAVRNDIIDAKYQDYTWDQMNAAISRAEFVGIFYGTLPESEYTAWNKVADNAISDVKLGDAYADEIYTFYRAGILTGNDAVGTFKPASGIKRSEVAAILIRMYDASARQEILLQ